MNFEPRANKIDLTIEAAKSGAAVLKRDGRFLASSVDPVREAKAWADRVCVSLAPNETMIVLGLGSGYHAATLLERRVPALIIEPQTEIIEQVRGFLPALSNMPTVSEFDWTQLTRHDLFRDAVCAPFRIGAHAPSVQIDPVYFGQVECLLLARDSLSFLMMLRTRPELLAQLDAAALGKAGADVDAVSIKTLARLFGPQSTRSRERRLWRILEELVV